MKKLFKGAIPTIAVLLAAIMSLTGLTYAWFTNGDTATVDTVNVGVKSVDGLLISANGYNGTWGSSMTPIFEGFVENKDEQGKGNGTYANDTDLTKAYRSVLQDVSSAGDLDANGKLKIYNAKYNNVFDALEYTAVADRNDPTDGSNLANWIQFDMYIKNDGTNDIVANLGGSTVTGSALSRAIARVAFVYQGQASSTAIINDKTSPSIKLGTTYNGSTTYSLLGIWEPNDSEHSNDGEVWLANNAQQEHNQSKATYKAVSGVFSDVNTKDKYMNVATGEVYTIVTSDNLTATAKYEYTKLADDATFDETKTYYTKSGDVYSEDNDVTGENFASKKANLYLLTKTYCDKTSLPSGTYYVFTSATDAAAGEHFEALDINSFFKPMLVAEALAGVNDKTYTKTGTGADAVYTLVTDPESIESTETYYQFATVGKATANVKAYTKTDASTDYMKDAETKDATAGDNGLKITVPAQTIIKVTVYIWLEGQDCDCTNYVAGNPFDVDIKLNAATNS